MPAIRDWTYNYTSSTSGTTITVPVPQYQQNDLLLAVLSTDTGTTQAWSSSGWTQLFSQSNTPNLAVMYKIASASEPEDYTFTYTIAETANGAILSIMDVDTSNPIDGYATANNTAARSPMPTRTASRNNSLNIYCWCHGSTAVIPSAIEGPVTQIISKDGAAHNDGFAWNFQVSAGTTPSDIYLSLSGTTYNGKKAIVTINPPSGGAQVIPAYCASDPSVYVDPIHGTTAYNGNTAFAGTATTYWTSPLAGRTLANATVTARTDMGINSYRSCGGMSGPTTANTYTGATKVLADANRPDITGKNVLIHAMPYLPVDIQTVYDVGLGKGIEVGMCSSVDNGKVWHLHGFGSPWGTKMVPLVIHPDNTSGLIDTRGTFDPTSVKAFGFFTCGFLVSSDWIYTMIWILGATVVAGGNASDPVGIEDIVRVVADGHERMSAIVQGKNQMLLLQPIQIGNGGTNPVYLDLNQTAIEFPQLYNTAARQCYYASVENVAGITYYAGANDTIKHRNSLISSASRYHWRLHPSSSTSATYDFSGLSVIGAGTISLAIAITISSITINDYSSLDISNLTLQNSEILNPPDTNNSITLNSSTTISGCSFNVTTLSAGNFLLSTATPNQFSNCSFTGATNAGHAIRITAPGTYTFSGNIFNGFGNDGTTSAAIFNDSGGLVTLNIVNGGNTPTYRNGTGSTTIINNAVNILVKCIDKNNTPLSRIGVYIEKASDKTQILNDVTNVNGEISTTYNYTADTLININIRRSSSGNKRYLPYSTTGTITTTGFNLTVVLYEDQIVSV